MREWRLPGLLRDYIVVHRRDRNSSRLPDADVWSAEQLVGRWLRDAGCRGSLMEIHAQFNGPLPFRVSREDNTAILRRFFLNALESGSLVVLDTGDALATPMAVPEEEKKEEEGGAEQRPPRPARKTWIAIKLRDKSGAPVPGVRYRITLPDFSTREGRLNDKGEARVDGIDSGNAELTFLDIDSADWRAA